MADWTPGPWRWEGNILGTRNRVIIAAQSGQAQRYGLMRVTEDIANARLIAAAPDLYAALESAPIVSKFNRAEDFISAYEAWVVSKRAALAKARGESDV